MNISYHQPSAPVNNSQQAHSLITDPDLAARVALIRPTGAFLYRKPRYDNQTIDIYDYYDAANLDEPRWAVISRDGVPMTCSCPDHKTRRRICKHMVLLAEQLAPAEAAPASAPPAPRPMPPKDEARAYYSFPVGAQLIVYGGGYLDVSVLDGTIENGCFYQHGSPIGVRITTRKATERERKAAVQNQPRKTEALPADFFNDWKGN